MDNKVSLSHFRRYLLFYWAGKLCEHIALLFRNVYAVWVGWFLSNFAEWPCLRTGRSDLHGSRSPGSGRAGALHSTPRTASDGTLHRDRAAADPVAGGTRAEVADGEHRSNEEVLQHVEGVCRTSAFSHLTSDKCADSSVKRRAVAICQYSQTSMVSVVKVVQHVVTGWNIIIIILNVAFPATPGTAGKTGP